ncbi:hypothetical protein [Roseivirga echinicomitans]|uniref:Uncharacterized protein n=1 Tax=Roseivirga echinicomitans TaxID=296218 RepID=A0A150X281_9BACT|nr:hypothetical protein [Roseivirga echinicomitans]KYG72825.1 hypothetical protein AWN68_08980 [Roseivirga echinicomitans]
MYFLNEDDPAFLFEGIVRAAFDNCSKWGDPFGYAAQDRYANFVGDIKLRGKRILATTISKVIIDHKDNEEAVKKLRKLDDKIWELKEQGEVIDWLEKLKNEMEELGY